MPQTPGQGLPIPPAWRETLYKPNSSAQHTQAQLRQGLIKAVEHRSQLFMFQFQQQVFEGLVFRTRDVVRGPQKCRTHHRRGAQRHQHRDQNSPRQDNGKLLKETPQNAPHEQYGNEDGDQRQAHGQDGEANFPSTLSGSLQRCLSSLHVPDDVFQNDDRIIHHKTRGNGERHQGQVVQRIVEQVHQSKGPSQGHWNGHTGDQGRSQAL